MRKTHGDRREEDAFYLGAAPLTATALRTLSRVRPAIMLTPAVGAVGAARGAKAEVIRA